jgi:hypothetical protein
MQERRMQRPPLRPSETYRPWLGAQSRPRWQTASAEYQAWLTISSPSICPSQTADADARKD